MYGDKRNVSTRHRVNRIRSVLKSWGPRGLFTAIRQAASDEVDAHERSDKADREFWARVYAVADGACYELEGEQ